MKPRIRLVLAIVFLLLILGLSLFAISVGNQGPAHLLPATVDHDCAPWDGLAFTISIHYDAGTVIAISIWQSPDFEFRHSFSFPDRNGKVGDARLQLQSGPPEQLSGRATLQPAEKGAALEGDFDFTAESGRPFRGTFHAVWGNKVALCG